MGFHNLLQGIFLTQGSNLQLWCLLPSQADSLPLYHLDFNVHTLILKCCIAKKKKKILSINWAFSKSSSFCNSNTKDHRSQTMITDRIIKKLETLQELPKYDTETPSQQMLLEKWNTPTMWSCSIYLKKKKKAHTQYLPSVIRQRAIKWGGPIHKNLKPKVIKRYQGCTLSLFAQK